MQQTCSHKWALFINSKFYLLFFILFSLSNKSLASRARLLSLQNKNHLLDTELIYIYPTKSSELDPYLSIESGQTTYLNMSQSAFAAGMIRYDKSTLSLTIGRQNELSGNQRSIFNQLTSEFFDLSQNPVSMIWSRKNQGKS